MSVASSVDPDQTAPLEAVWSDSTLFAYMLKWPCDVSNMMQETALVDPHFYLYYFVAGKWLKILLKTTIIIGKQCRPRRDTFWGYLGSMLFDTVFLQGWAWIGLKNLVQFFLVKLIFLYYIIKNVFTVL